VGLGPTLQLFNLFTCSSIAAGTLATTVCFSGSPAIENGLRTAHTSRHCNGIHWTVFGAGTAFHTGIPVMDDSFGFHEGKNSMRTHFHTASTADALAGIEF
jgi:hypothetical protein